MSTHERAQVSGWLTFRRALAKALRRRCPRCGEGALFATRFRLRDACDSCGLRYRREQGAMTGSMYLSAAVTEVFAAAVIAVTYLATDWGALTSIAVGLPLVLAFCYAFLPLSHAIWTAVEYATDVANREPWA